MAASGPVSQFGSVLTTAAALPMRATRPKAREELIVMGGQGQLGTKRLELRRRVANNADGDSVKGKGGHIKKPRPVRAYEDYSSCKVAPYCPVRKWVRTVGAH